MAKFLKLEGGLIKETPAATTGGAGDANKIPELDGNGRLPSNMMPVGLGADTGAIEASENLTAGDYVNIWDDGGSFKVRKADASTAGKEAHGFVLAAVTSGQTATVYFEGVNDQVSGMTPGVVFLSAATAGQGTATAPSGSSQVVQRLGIAISATEVNFEAASPIYLAA